MSYNLKITVFNNRDYAQTFTLEDDEAKPLDLTGSKLIFGIGTPTKRLQSHDTSLTASNKCIFIVDAANGQIRLELPYSLLKDLQPADYIHDLILIDGNGKRSGIWAGQMAVKRGVA